MKKYASDRTALSIIRILMLILTLGIIIAARYYLYIIPILMWIVMGLFGAAFIFLGIIWLPLYFGSLSYTISPEEITRTAGFFFRKRQVMKPSAVQYVTLVTTPLAAIPRSRGSGLNFVILNALGGNLTLLFLSKKDALEIQKTLEEYLKIYA